MIPLPKFEENNQKEYFNVNRRLVSFFLKPKINSSMRIIFEVHPSREAHYFSPNLNTNQQIKLFHSLLRSSSNKRKGLNGILDESKSN
jgi:hypothetical protein